MIVGTWFVDCVCAKQGDGCHSLTHKRKRGGSVTIFLSIFFTRFLENIHSPSVVHSISALRRHLIPTRIIKGIPSEKPIISIGGVRIVDILLQFGLVQV